MKGIVMPAQLTGDEELGWLSAKRIFHNGRTYP